jgi:phenylpropionate dioxygenase-like ring-hydroxylating dioxygenase large terminal subunit
MNSFIRNTWYPAAWSDELTRALLPRTFLEIPVVLYRKLDGTPAAIQDTCPHRFAPLHKGTLQGDEVQCGYHGLRFDANGKCTHNPHMATASANIKVRSFPVVERYGMIWIWPGDAGCADESNVPDFSYMTAPNSRTLSGHYVTQAHYELVTDNLLDLTHTEFLHTNFLESGMLMAKRELTYEGSRLHLTYRCPPGLAPPNYRAEMPDPAALVQHWFDVNWQAPGFAELRTGIQRVGNDDPGQVNTGTHLVTPETARSTHYFYAGTRTTELNNAEVDARIRHWHKEGFSGQDKPMIEAVQQRMDGTDLLAMKPLLFPGDAAAVRARRIIKELLEREANAATPADAMVQSP